MAFIGIGTPAGLTGPVTDRYTVLKAILRSGNNLVVSVAGCSVNAWPKAIVVLLLLVANFIVMLGDVPRSQTLHTVGCPLSVAGLAPIDLHRRSVARGIIVSAVNVQAYPGDGVPERPGFLLDDKEPVLAGIAVKGCAAVAVFAAAVAVGAAIVRCDIEGVGAHGALVLISRVAHTAATIATAFLKRPEEAREPAVNRAHRKDKQ